jgi:acetylornithine deacetylase
MLDICDAHKGVRTFQTMVKGFAAHSPSRSSAPAPSMPARCSPPSSTRWRKTPSSGRRSGRFDPPYDTIHIGTFHGGIARNILADRSEILWEIRTVPSSDPEAGRRASPPADKVLARMRSTAPSAAIETQMTSDVGAGARSGLGGRAARHAALRPQPHHRRRLCDRGRAFPAGRPADRGLRPGSIDQAHQPDEYITLEQLAAGETFMRKLMAECQAG